MKTGENSIALLGTTWNILNQSYIEGKYSHAVDRRTLAWTCRLPLIIELLLSTQSDVLFLQEVELKTAAVDFLPLFLRSWSLRSRFYEIYPIFMAP